MNENLHKAKQEFLTEWPLSRILKMTLEEYTNLDKTSFCYWLEAKTYHLGSIWGGSSYKFGIYKRRDTSTVITVDNRMTDGEYAWFQKYGTTKEKAFETIKNIIIKIIENVQNNTLENIDAIDLGDAYKWKIAFLYGNMNIVNIFKNESLFEAAQSLHYNQTDKSYSTLNRYILNYKEKEVDYFDFTSELWKTTSLANPQKYWLYAPGEKAIKWNDFQEQGIMALGWDAIGDLEQYKNKKAIKNALVLAYGGEGDKKNDVTANDDFINNLNIGDVVIVKKGRSELLGYGVVTSDYYFDNERENYKHCREVDWQLTGNWNVDFSLVLKTLTDVTKYPTEDPNYAKYSEKLMSIMKGDYVARGIKLVNVKGQFIDWMIANDAEDCFYFSKQFGSNKIRFQKEIDSYETVYKEFFNADLFIVDVLNMEETIAVLKSNIYDNANPFSKFSKERVNGRPKAILGKNNYLKFLKEKFMENDTNNNALSDTLPSDYPLNQILYGPPGTGKTYHTVLEAAKIVTGNESITYDEALKVFNENLGTQIEFITFHQNYSYEDFIQGLRPDTGNGTALTFEKKDGVFKRIADRALFEYYIEIQKNKSVTSEIYLDVNEVYLDFYNSLSVGQEFLTKTNVTIKLVQRNENKNLVFKYVNGNRPVLVSSNRLLKLFEKIPNISLVQNINEDIRAAIGGCDATIYYTMLKEFIAFYEANKSRVQSKEEYQDFDYLDITEERKKEILAQISVNDLRAVDKNAVKNYVIIIDEINRANISRVFGELITLIEEDKRSHGKIPMRVTLPSGDTFIVPSNLYLIGTMNTADKSIALLDIALRRRFQFVPMYPDATLDSVHDKEILTAINTAILQRKSHDFTIGHAYFMGENFDLEKTINHKVIPLLLEYFMNDEKEVIAILGEAKLTVGSWPLKLL